MAWSWLSEVADWLSGAGAGAGLINVQPGQPASSGPPKVKDEPAEPTPAKPALPAVAPDQPSTPATPTTIIAIFNATRAALSPPLPPLLPSPRLCLSAHLWAASMAVKGQRCAGHPGEGRIAASFFIGTGIASHSTLPPPTAKEVAAAWLASPEDWANVTGNYASVGVSSATSRDGLVVWAADFVT